MNTNFIVIGLTRPGIKPKSTAPEADVLTTRPSELSICDGLSRESADAEGRPVVVAAKQIGALYLGDYRLTTLRLFFLEKIYINSKELKF